MQLQHTGDTQVACFKYFKATNLFVSSKMSLIQYASTQNGLVL